MKLITAECLRDLLALFLTVVILAGCSPAAKKARIIERADRYFKAGEYDKAKIEYMNLLRRDQQNVRAFQQLGFIWSEQGVPLRAIPFLRKVKELAPRDIAARSKLALDLMTLGQLAEARKEALWILQQDPANPDAVILVADTIQTKEEIAATEQELAKVPKKDTVAFHLAAALLAAKKGDAGAASGEVQQALIADPKSARAHLTMGYIYLLRKNPSHAGPELKTAADLAPVRSEERIKYVEFQIANGASDQARVLLQDTTKQAPDYLPAWGDLARIALAEKKYDEALSLLQNIFTRDPDNPDARMLEAQAWLGKGDNAKAIAVLDKLNTVFPNNPVIKYQLARAYVTNKNLAQATAQLEQALAINPDYIEANLLLAQLNLGAGKLQAVVAAMEQLRKKRPDLPQARVMLADGYRALGRLEEAAALFREELNITPQSAGDHFLLAVTLRQENKNAEARSEFEKVVELTPDNWRAVDQLVEMDVAEKQYDAATQRVRHYFQTKPDGAAGHFMLGKIHAPQHHWAEAESELQKAIDVDPNFSSAYESLISVYAAQRKLPQAIAELETSAKRQPDDPRILFVLALLYEQMHDYEKARDAYEKVLTIKPDMATVLNNLAYLYAERLPQLDRAYELAQKARALQPDEASVADSLGWILYKRGDYQQALGLLQESAGKLPENPEVQFHLGMTASMMGQADLARVALEKAAHAAVDFPGKEEAERRLASLEGHGAVPAGEANALPQQQSTDLLALTRLAESDQKKGELAEAAAAYEQALKLNSKLPDVTLKLAQLYAGPLKQRDKALEFAKKARALAPNDAQAAAILGRVAFQTGNFTWAYSLLQESARQRRDDPSLLYDLAWSSYALGNLPEARQTMQRFLDIASDVTQSEEAKRFLTMTARDQPSAEILAEEADVQNILKAQPDYVPALMAQAAIQLQRNDTKAAADTYSKVLQKYPDFAPAQKRLATIYAGNSESLGKAYELAVKARKTLSDDPELTQILAEISYKRKEFAYAIQLFQESGKRKALDSRSLYYLGMSQWQTTQKTQGRDSLERALGAGLPEPLATEAKRVLAESKAKD